MTYSVVEFETNEFIFKQGDPGDLMYLVQDGEVEVIQDLGGHENQVAVLERGDFFGEMAVLEDEPRTHSVRALSDTKLIKIDRTGFQSMLTRNAEIAVRMIRKLGLRLMSAEDMLVRAWAAEGRTTVEAQMRVRGSARLVLVADGTELALPDQTEVKLGRVDPINQIRPDVDLTKVDSQLTTSRRHAKILRGNEGFFIQEERATNGTFVNGQRISAERPLEIRSGDDIMFGAVRMQFLLDTPD
ncbi:MAG: cyclic nucleotide-binding domain-containing protein [bacterium]|nr:cyclic nucleotide-binding domain-containing protein [bacterium]